MFSNSSLKKLKFNFLKLLDILVIKSERTKNIVKHVGWSMFYKVGSIICNFLIVPITINYLDTENYGVWLTISSFIGWFSLFDIGLGNGLRNKFAEAKTRGNYQDAQAFVSTAYFSISCISLALLLVFSAFNFFIDWGSVFNASQEVAQNLPILMVVVFGFFCIQLSTKLIVSIYLADQNHSMQNKVQFYTLLLNLLVVWLLTQTNEGSLLIFGTFYSAVPVIILVIMNIIAFNNGFYEFRPKWSLFDKKYLSSIMGDGVYFFVIQIAAMVLFTTDNFIISHLFSPDEVVPYNVSLKYFSLVITGYTLLVNPFWTAFTEAFTKKDFTWIRTSVKNIQKIWIIIPIGLVFMILCADWFYDIWVGDKVTIPFKLNLSMAFFVLLTTFNMVYSFFLNGVGKFKIQLYTASASILLNIPMSIYFASYLGFGVSGVILATCFSVGLSTIFKVIQYTKIINHRAIGIWNK